MDSEIIATRYNALHKVGGSHLISVSAFEKVRALFDTKQPQLIIISALGQTTANLQRLLDMAKMGEDYQRLLKHILSFHQSLASKLLNDPLMFDQYIKEDVLKLGVLLKKIVENQDYDETTQDYVLSLGEYWSSYLFGQYWNKDHTLLDAANVLVVEKKARRCVVDWQASEKNLSAFIKQSTAKHLLITGYVAKDNTGQRVTLGFEGSDFSAAIFAHLFHVESVTFWSDVDGLFSADPMRVKHANIIPELSYLEAMELAYLGSSILHPQAIEPLMAMQVPIYLRNAYQASTRYTTISGKTKAGVSAVRGISMKDDISLINIEGTGVLEASVLVVQALDALSASHLPVLLITQASSSHSLCIAVENQDVENAIDCLMNQFDFELKENIIHGITHKQACAMLAIVGDAMVGEVGCSAQLLRCLAKANINVLALSQGSSERNISVVVDAKQAVRAINVVHSGLYLSKRQLQIGLIGPGNVGRVFLKQLLENKDRLEKELGVCFYVTGIASSGKMSFPEEFKALDAMLSELTVSDKLFEFPLFIKQLQANDFTHTAIIDCTASESVSDYYQMILDQGFHVITPNKKVSSGLSVRFDAVKAACASNRRYFLYETNVCAGLPIIKTLQDLVATGDVIERIEGVFSGTLSYLFNELSNGISFSKALMSAYKLGLTEPDPRDDLNGMDVARKCVCLAREMGVLIELEQVNIIPILPKALMEGSVEDFLAKGEAMDAVFHEQLASLQISGNKLVYQGEITAKGSIRLSMTEVDKSHAFYNLKGTDNMVVFKTQRYDEYPLIIQGPGAGADVTAAGVFADLLRLVSLTSGE